MLIDSHQHFWIYNPTDYGWIDDSMVKIKNDYLPNDLKVHLEKNKIGGCVTVQCNHCEAETVFLLNLARKNDFIKAVVGWVDLRADDLEEKLTVSTKNEFYKGVRHVVQNEEKGFLLDYKFIKGIGILKKFNLTYDILVYPHQLKEVLEFIKLCPDQPFVIDHLAKPNIKEGQITEWKKGIRTIAKFKNVYCKLSGMVTEADWEQWSPDQLYPYMDVIIDSFGVGRVMYGSDWPVCNLAAPYNQVIDVVKKYTQDFSENEKSQIFGLNAKSFYNIES